MLEFELEIHNDSGEKQDIGYSGTLFRLSGDASPNGDFVHHTDRDDLTSNPKSTVKRKLCLNHLPQPGNYSFRLDLETRRGEDYKNAHGYAVYFDALPKDATSFNVVTVIISGLIGVIIGLILGS